MAGKTQSQKKKVLDMRSKMYLVLALCSVMLLVSVGISLVLIGRHRPRRRGRPERVHRGQRVHGRRERL